MEMATTESLSAHLSNEKPSEEGDDKEGDKKGKPEDAEKKDPLRMLNKSFAKSFIGFIMALVIGTVFYATVENCTCSYEESKVPGCDPDRCEDTGGYSKTI